LDSSVVRRASGASRCYREVPFSMVRGETIVEGKMDMVFVEDGELVVVDYKTDAEPPGGFEALAERYGRQALAYGVAAEATTGIPLKEVVLLFLSPETPVEMSVEMGSTRAERESALDRALEEARAGA
ncbi:MAG: PD-(D/E)XK nuclease family protein, partial [Candidatus Eisenbacteria bacterium]